MAVLEIPALGWFLMYGPEYLDWRDKARVADQIDEFLAAMPVEDRVWALAVLRDRHVVYRNNPLYSLPGIMPLCAMAGHRTNPFQQSLANQRQSGGLAENLLGSLGRPFV